MKIEQKKISHKHIFTFNKDALNFAYEDKSGSADVDIPYANISKKTSIRIDENTWLRNVGYVWMAVGLIGLVMNGWLLWLPIGIACVAISFYTKVKFTVMQNEHGGVWVIQDKNHDSILEEIRIRKQQQLLDWYGGFNSENTLNQEIAKFKWLAEQGVISDLEANNKIAQATTFYQTDDEIPRLLN
ncbi:MULTISPECIES: hypothetical protein [Deefgea]|uniref:Uncharacterized protein n=1 Tax=Deefgea chitinilytica TaxID=570276 RepID=A0ABS2CFN5_9NEIS|nr:MULTISPECIES: hypothetical protein [Deefgea]MBM5572228.1 hypothetical protein [Deefgea chitinilytica]MBM9889463.1 hypothetical protein [Deefgea sp. CFH1-16]